MIGAPASETPRPGWELLVTTEVALAACTVASLTTFGRLFVDNSFFPKLFLAAVGGHASAALWRRLDRSLPLAAVAHTVLGVVVLGLVFHADTTLAGVPTPSTLSAGRQDLIDAWRQFQEVKAPAPVLPGFLVAGAVTTWWTAFVADWAAFRLWLPLESMVPSASVFVFAALLGQPDHRVFSAVVWLVPVLLFALCHRATVTGHTRGWIPTGESATAPTLVLGMAAMAVAIGAAALIGPRIPGADAQPLLDVTGQDGDDSSRVVTSPFLQLRSRLSGQSSTELFTVKVDTPDTAGLPYWRMTSLHKFEGSSWSSPKTDYKSANDELPHTGDTPEQSRTIRQTVTIQNLGTIWLPAAYQPVSIDADRKVRWDPKSSTLIVGDDALDGNGLQYTVESAMPDFDKAAVAAAGDGPIPDSVAEVDLDLSEDFSPIARSEAAELLGEVGQGAGPYRKALALQNYFSPDNGFTYDLNPPRVPDRVHPMDDFLTKKVGFCQQYAGTYAAMARAMGLPARVAVGFTPGEPDPDDSQLLHVKGLNAHAWPEVYIAGQGWVPFEPTPGRGQGGVSDITERQPQQGTSDGSPGTPGATTTTAAPEGGSGDDEAGSESGVGSAAESTTTTTASPDKPDPPVAEQVADGLRTGAIAGLVVLIVVGGSLIGWWRFERRRRKQRTTDPPEVVALAWERSLESLALIGFRPSTADTPVETAKKAEAMTGEPVLQALATALTMAAFSAEGADTLLARSAAELAEEVEVAVDARMSWPQRIASWLRPWGQVRQRFTRSRTPDQQDSDTITPLTTIDVGS